MIDRYSFINDKLPDLRSQYRECKNMKNCYALKSAEWMNDIKFLQKLVKVIHKFIFFFIVPNFILFNFLLFFSFCLFFNVKAIFCCICLSILVTTTWAFSASRLICCVGFWWCWAVISELAGGRKLKFWSALSCSAWLQDCFAIANLRI